MNKQSPTLESTNQLFKTRYEAECLRVNGFMSWLMVAQWFVGIGFAFFYSPLTWIGQEYEIHVHVWAAILIGGAISGFAILWLRFFPREVHSRHVVAITQVLWSALLIHLSGGRIETHFHVFASLAILSIYRDWKILITATAVVAVDHFVRGVFYPLSAFGIVSESPFRWIEHAAWVLFEVAFLAPGCHRLRNEIRELCVRQTEIEEAKRDVDQKVQDRTRDLVQANSLLAQQKAESERLAMVARYTDNAVIITDGESQIEWVNEGFTRISGYSLGEVRGQKLADFQHGPLTCQKTVEQMRSAIESRQGFNTEVVNYRRNGEPYWLAIEVRPIHDEDGQVCRFIAINSDVSERKSIELSLHSTEKRLRSLVNNVPGVFYRQTVSEDYPQFMSDSIRDLTGYAREDFVETKRVNLDQVIFSTDRDVREQAIAEAIANQSDFEVEYRIVDSEDNVKWVWERAQCVPAEDGDGEPVLDGTIFDITERVQSEAKTQKLQQELVDASRQAGMAEVATGVLHNVGNILNSVNVSASVIRKHYSTSALGNLEKVSGLIEEYRSSFADFVREDNRGRRIPDYIVKVTDLLCEERVKVNHEFDDLLKNVDHIKEIVTVQQSMAKSSGLHQELDANDIVHDVLIANKGSLVNHHIKVTHEVGTAVPRFVSDKHRILQILINLVKNAKDALVECEIRDPEINICVNSDGNHVRFEVMDNGVGIPAEKIDKIFQHGFTTKDNGHGFGLHASANAAVELGGVLTVSSDGLGTGATFSLSLPIVEMSIPTQDGIQNRENHK